MNTIKKKLEKLTFDVHVGQLLAHLQSMGYPQCNEKHLDCEQLGLNSVVDHYQLERHNVGPSSYQDLPLPLVCVPQLFVVQHHRSQHQYVVLGLH